MSDRPAWFAAKRYGYGAGWPIAWQGWALLLTYALLIGCAFLLFGKDDPRASAIIVPATLALLIVTAVTTRDGWRWGDD